ncbi:sigma-70 family RNA polymerase sigma factor [Sediminibacillus massiliensis]|uniref:sigma-70 family RNA polymerase sigma factor n=1 Tax=Sediminibacillus massiliensis TaxID=1926277 RepID=UPI0009885B04|nr:sigma-70 family RNA polymerase sigma factor [Sediminibacillus massiliensis]
MDCSKATNKQLWIIFQEDWDVPKELMKPLVEEAFQRNLFDNLIKHLINKMFNRFSNMRRYHFKDLFQHGYIGVVSALKAYKPGKGSFKTFAYLTIKAEFLKLIVKENSQKREHEKDMISLNVPQHDDNETSFLDQLADNNRNVEKTVLSKMYWREELNKLSPREQEVLIYFSQGYTLSEMAEMYKLKSSVSLHRQMNRAFMKLNPNRPKVSLKELGIVTRRKDMVGA